MLSAHEIATLLLLLNAPVDVMAATPDVMALREVGLVQLVASEQGEARYAHEDNADHLSLSIFRRLPYPGRPAVTSP